MSEQRTFYNFFQDFTDTMNEKPKYRFSIDALTLELQWMIISFLHQRDIASIRLVCKSLAHAGESHLVRKVYCFNSFASIDRLIKISNNENLARFVKAVHFDLSRFQYYDTLEEWEEERIDRAWMIYAWNLGGTDVPGDYFARYTDGFRRMSDGHRERYRAQLSESEWLSVWQKHCRLVGDQQRNAPVLQLARNMESIFSRFPRLEHFFFTEWITESPGHVHLPLNSPLLTQQWVHIDYETSMALSKAFVAAFLRTRLRTMTTTCIPACSLPITDQFTSYPSLDRLTSLRLYFEACSNEFDSFVTAPIWSSRENTVALAQLLRSAPNLPTLKLGISRDFANCSMNIEEAVGGITWKYFRTCSLSDFRATETYLVDFLLRHGQSLLDLALADCKITGSWETACTAMCGKLNALHVFLLDGRLIFDLETLLFADVSGYSITEQAETLTSELHEFLRSGGGLPNLSTLSLRADGPHNTMDFFGCSGGGMDQVDEWDGWFA